MPADFISYTVSGEKMRSIMGGSAPGFKVAKFRD